MIRRSALLAFITAGMSLVSAGAHAQDFILHVAGDSINGDLKGLERGKLRFEIPGSGTFPIDWIQIRGVGSPGIYEVEVETGERYFGSLQPGETEGTLAVVGESAIEIIALVDIIKIASIEGSFLARFDGLIEFGFTYAKANKAVNYSLETQVNYRTRHDIITLSANSYLQNQAEAESTKRSQAQLSYDRLLSKGWLLGGRISTEQNQELDLDLRVSIGARRSGGP